jgi:hypothetical protein
VPAQQIAQNLAYINWTVLAGLGLGSFATVVLARARTNAPRGFLAFTALCAAAFAGLAWLADGAIPAAIAAGTLPAPGAAAAGAAGRLAPDQVVDQARAAGLAVLGFAALGWAVAERRGRPAAGVLGAVGLASGGVAIGAAAYGWGGGIPGGLPLFLQFALLSAATGGVFASMILGHWYLVSPKLGERPLVLLSRVLLGVLLGQLALFLLSLATGAGVGDPPFHALVGSWALFVWLRLIVGLIFPVIVSWAAVQTARSRSMESATGLLYINVGAIAAGTILASGLYFGAGLLV